MILLLLCVLLKHSLALRERVIIDTDASAFVSNGFGVDDDLALVYALGTNKIHVLGITATYGNTDLSSSVNDINTLLSLTQVKQKKNDEVIKVYAGADWSSKNNLSHSTNAVAFMARTLQKYPRETVTIMCLGSLTNLASLITLHPELSLKLRAIILSAGREGGFELNLFAHPEATKVVLETPIPKLVLLPPSMHGLQFSPSRIERLEKACCSPNSNNGKKVVCELVPYMKHSSYWQSLLFNRFLSSDQPIKEGFYPFALITLLLLTNASQFGESHEIHMEMRPSDSFLEEPELKIFAVSPNEFARRRLFENLVLEAGRVINVENVYSELIIGLCSASYKQGVETNAVVLEGPSLASSLFGLRGLLLPALNGVVFFQNLLLVVVLSIILCTLVVGLLSSRGKSKKEDNKRQ